MIIAPKHSGITDTHKVDDLFLQVIIANGGVLSLDCSPVTEQQAATCRNVLGPAFTHALDQAILSGGHGDSFRQKFQDTFASDMNEITRR